MTTTTTPSPCNQGEGKGEGSSDLFFPQEQCLCLQCHAQIPRQNVIAQIDTLATGPTRQRVRAWCEHCKTMYELYRRLSGGVWQTMGKVEIVASDTRRRQFLKRLTAQRGLIDADSS